MILSGGGVLGRPDRPKVYIGRLVAIAALEAVLLVDGLELSDPKGNPGVRCFAEGTRSALTWGGRRLDVIKELQ